jgi:hypothetical protein
MADDGYVSWYQSKLWNLLPAVYRTQDAAVPGVPGPLQELLSRIGAQVATLRRSIDRLGENQSIETCDDWMIPYIGDLLATRLVSCLNANAQRLDVANTIYYRRRAGTLGLLEELVTDIALRDARAVEFFRRLGRMRHQFDPPIGNAFLIDAASWVPLRTYAVGDIVANELNAYECVAGGESGISGGPVGGGSSIVDGGVTWSFYSPASSLVPAVIEGLAGADSRTPAGGFADLRNAYAAANANTAFDEFAHTADLRAGAQSFGWQNISHLGMFIRWLQTYSIMGATPVSNGKPSPCYTFDPSGRQIPLFAPQSRTTASYGDDWVSPNEWQLPVAVRQTLWNAYPDQLYPSSSEPFALAARAFAVGVGGGPPAVVPRAQLTIHPENGLFSFKAPQPQNANIVTRYHFGLMSTVGAGGFPSALLEAIAMPTSIPIVTGGGGALAQTLGGSSGDATVTIGDSLTYTGDLIAPLAVDAATVAIVALDGQRPVIRWTATLRPSWLVSGNGGNLILQGIWLLGADIVLTGAFQSVTLRFVTLDPGTAGPPGVPVGAAIDGVMLAPTRLWVEAEVETLTLESCITGPIRTRNGGAIEQLTATGSILQAINTAGSSTDYALQTEIGDISLARCTVLGPSAIHRLDASECILDDVTQAEDVQHGCVRFCAIAIGSALHAPYHCVNVPPVGSLFFSRHFGEPNYARLYRLADKAIVNPQTGDTILGGGANGAEMGVFQSIGETLTKRGLALKFEEYAPLGVFPVWIDAD